MAGLLCLTAGCGSEEAAETEVDARTLLSDYEAKLVSRRHANLREWELGQFFVSRFEPAQRDSRVVSFELYGLLPKEDESEFENRYQGRESRCRDAVLSVVKTATAEELRDPVLTALKEKVTQRLNEILKKPRLEDVIFADFTVE